MGPSEFLGVAELAMEQGSSAAPLGSVNKARISLITCRSEMYSGES